MCYCFIEPNKRFEFAKIKIDAFSWIFSILMNNLIQNHLVTMKILNNSNSHVTNQEEDLEKLESAENSYMYAVSTGMNLGCPGLLHIWLINHQTYVKRNLLNIMYK